MYVPTIGLSPLTGFLALGTGALVIVACIHKDTVDTALFWIRVLHWSITLVGIGYPFVCGPAQDLWFISVWVAVMVSWAAFDNVCVVSLMESRNMDSDMVSRDPTMFQLPMPWPAFLALYIVVLRYSANLDCTDSVIMRTVFATYIVVHYMIYRSQQKRWQFNLIQDKT